MQNPLTKKRKPRDAAPPIGDRLLTLREAADVLRLSTSTFREYVSRGEIEGRVIGGRWRFGRADLDAFLKTGPRVGLCWKGRRPGLDVEQRKTQIRRSGGRFYGIPYLLIWRSWRDSQVKEAVRISATLVRNRGRPSFLPLERAVANPALVRSERRTRLKKGKRQRKF